MGVILSAGIFVGCKNKKTTSAENFTFTYVLESATKTDVNEESNIKLNLSVKNDKNEENTLLASKFTLKQQNKVVSTSAFLGNDQANKKDNEKFDAMKTCDVVLNFVTPKTLTGECELFYGETKLFIVNL